LRVAPKTDPNTAFARAGKTRPMQPIPAHSTTSPHQQQCPVPVVACISHTHSSRAQPPTHPYTAAALPGRARLAAVCASKGCTELIRARLPSCTSVVTRRAGRAASLLGGAAANVAVHVVAAAEAVVDVTPAHSQSGVGFCSDGSQAGAGVCVSPCRAKGAGRLLLVTGVRAVRQLLVTGVRAVRHATSLFCLRLCGSGLQSCVCAVVTAVRCQQASTAQTLRTCCLSGTRRPCTASASHHHPHHAGSTCRGAQDRHRGTYVGLVCPRQGAFLLVSHYTLLLMLPAGRVTGDRWVPTCPYRTTCQTGLQQQCRIHTISKGHVR
jgi:hypothetical protein